MFLFPLADKRVSLTVTDVGRVPAISNQIINYHTCVYSNGPRRQQIFRNNEQLCHFYTINKQPALMISLLTYLIQHMLSYLSRPKTLFYKSVFLVFQAFRLACGRWHWVRQIGYN